MFFIYSSWTDLPYLFITIIRFSDSVSYVPSNPGLKCMASTLPSVLLASRIFPLKPQLRSVMPMVKASMRMASGFARSGFQTVIVDSAEARAIML